LQFYQNCSMQLQLFSSYHNSSIAAIQLCIISRPVTYPRRGESHIGEKKLLQHDDLHQLLKGIRGNGQRTLVSVHHDMEEIHHVLARAKKDGEHRWWDTLFRWSPTMIRILNQMLHPTVILLTLVLLLNVFVCIRVGQLARRVTLLQNPTYICEIA